MKHIIKDPIDKPTLEEQRFFLPVNDIPHLTGYPVIVGNDFIAINSCHIFGAKLGKNKRGDDYLIIHDYGYSSIAMDRSESRSESILNYMEDPEQFTYQLSKRFSHHTDYKNIKFLWCENLFEVTSLIKVVLGKIVLNDLDSRILPEDRFIKACVEGEVSTDDIDKDEIIAFNDARKLGYITTVGDCLMVYVDDEYEHMDPLFLFTQHGLYHYYIMPNSNCHGNDIYYDYFIESFLDHRTDWIEPFNKTVDSYGCQFMATTGSENIIKYIELFESRYRQEGYPDAKLPPLEVAPFQEFDREYDTRKIIKN